MERSLAGRLKELTESPGGPDLLSGILRMIRVSSSMQYCFMPTGDWEVDATPAPFRPKASMGFHIMAAGSCRMRIGADEVSLGPGDIAVLPFSTPHRLIGGAGGPEINPGGDLPPQPWREVPVLRYGADPGVRILCGYLVCDPMRFGPFRDILPGFIHVRTSSPEFAWLKPMMDQIVTEVDRPKDGGFTILERLTEVMFVEILRNQIASLSPGATGWLAALGDPALGRALAAIHDDPAREWDLAGLAREAGLSRSTLAERFEAVLATSPMRYLREWRLYLASVELQSGNRPVARIAEEAGYATVAAFSRAFARAHGTPPAAFRAQSAAR